jgi:hypothetical protein
MRPNNNRSIGDIVRVHLQEFNLHYNVQIPDIPENRTNYIYCTHCNNKQCRIWPTVWILDCNGAVFSELHNIGECHMYDLTDDIAK